MIDWLYSLPDWLLLVACAAVLAGLITVLPLLTHRLPWLSPDSEKTDFVLRLQATLVHGHELRGRLHAGRGRGPTSARSTRWSRRRPPAYQPPRPAAGALRPPDGERADAGPSSSPTRGRWSPTSGPAAGAAAAAVTRRNRTLSCLCLARCAGAGAVARAGRPTIHAEMLRSFDLPSPRRANSRLSAVIRVAVGDLLGGHRVCRADPAVRQQRHRADALSRHYPGLPDGRAGRLHRLRVRHGPAVQGTIGRRSAG